jgi:hypothetical protein
MSTLFRRLKHSSGSETEKSRATSSTGSNVAVADGDLKYIGGQGGNVSTIAYQEASGAPVETKSPLGYNVGPVTIVFLNLSKMVGTGIFSTRMYRQSDAAA